MVRENVTLLDNREHETGASGIDHERITSREGNGEAVQGRPEQSGSGRRTRYLQEADNQVKEKIYGTGGQWAHTW